MSLVFILFFDKLYDGFAKRNHVYTTKNKTELDFSKIRKNKFKHLKILFDYEFLPFVNNY